MGPRTKVLQPGETRGGGAEGAAPNGDLRRVSTLRAPQSALGTLGPLRIVSRLGTRGLQSLFDARGSFIEAGDVSPLWRHAGVVLWENGDCGRRARGPCLVTGAASYGFTGPVIPQLAAKSGRERRRSAHRGDHEDLVSPPVLGRCIRLRQTRS